MHSHIERPCELVLSWSIANKLLNQNNLAQFPRYFLVNWTHLKTHLAKWQHWSQDLVICLIEVSLFDVLGFFLDVFARRPEVTHTSDPTNNEQSKHDTADGDGGGWIDHGWGLMRRLQLMQKVHSSKLHLHPRLFGKLWNVMQDSINRIGSESRLFGSDKDEIESQSRV